MFYLESKYMYNEKHCRIKEYMDTGRLEGAFHHNNNKIQDKMYLLTITNTD